MIITKFNEIYIEYNLQKISFNNFSKIFSWKQKQTKKQWRTRDDKLFLCNMSLITM